MRREITFVTSNVGKFIAAKASVHPYGLSLTRAGLCLPEIQSLSCVDVATRKVIDGFEALQCPLFAEDTGLEILDLGFPGALLKPTLTALGAEGLARLADMSDRRCRFTSCLAYLTDGEKPRLFISAGPRGEMARHPVGDKAADPWGELRRVFIPEGATQPLGALSPKHQERFIQDWRRRNVYTALAEWLRRPE